METIGKLLVRLRFIPSASNDPGEEYHSQLGLKDLLFQAYSLLVQQGTDPIRGALEQVRNQVVLLLEGALREELCEVTRARCQEEDVEDHLRQKEF